MPAFAGMTGEGAGGGKRPVGVRRAAFRDLMRVLQIVGKPAWATPVLIGVGLASSFAETIGITLILLFLYAVTGHTANTSGLLGMAVGRASHIFGSTSKLAWLILAMIVARGALAMLYNRISTNIAAGISERTRNLVHAQYLKVAYSFIQTHTQANLIEVLATESWEIATAYSSFTRLVINACSIAVFTLFLTILSWKIMLVAFAGSTLISMATRLFTGRARVLGAEVKKTHEYLSMQMLMTIQGMRTIRAYGQEAAHQELFTHNSFDARAVTNALARLSAWIGPVTEVGYLGILCAIIAGSNWWHTSFTLTLGAVALLYRLQPHTREFEDHLMHFAQTQPQLQSIRMMLETDDKEYPPEGSIPFSRIERGIVFRHVDFRYEKAGSNVLSDLCFEIPAGVTTALIGASGAGKTTIVNLLMRLYEPSAGEITVDGVRLSDLRRTDWVRQLGLAGQDTELVGGTVMDNIRMADPFCEESKVIAVAKIAGVAPFVEHLPEGYDTWVGPEGLRFSGGQRQRIGLARAILRDSHLLILDEAMSALDRGLEDQVKHDIDARMAARTTLLITHRLETVKDVQHVIWIEDGRVRAEGPPALVLPQAILALAPSEAREATQL
jgi:ABC-type multidrug transport system fused ATPase/permease subunit